MTEKEISPESIDNPAQAKKKLARIKLFDEIKCLSFPILAC